MIISRPAVLGFTLWELLCALAVAGVALALGAPTLRDVVLDARRLGAVNSLVATVRFARTEAQKRGRTIVLCQSSNLGTCTGEPDFGAGWIVFENTDGVSPPQRSAAERLLRAERPAFASVVDANRTTFEFRPFPLRSTNGTIDFCDGRGAAHARSVIVSYTGRPRIASVTDGRCGDSS